MARDVTELDDDGSGGTRREESEKSGNTGLLDRRSYLRLAGTAAAVVGGTVATGTAAAGGYEVIEARGQTIEIGDGEVWENKLVDMTTGGDVSIVASGTGWTIRNVGFRGRNTSDTGTATFGLSDQGGNTSLVENVYLGDGSTDGNRQPNGHGQTAFWIHPAHSGHIDFRRVNIQGFADNAIYGSAPHGRGGGTIHVDECYAANCYVSHYRLGTPGSKVTNSVVKLDEEGYDGRGVWAWGPVEVEDCVVETNGRHYALVTHDGGRLTVRGTAFDGGTSGRVTVEGDAGSNPSAYVPDGVPETAEEAASAGGDDERILVIDGAGTDGVTDYRFAAAGDVEPSTDRGASIGADPIADGTVSGAVGGWRDAYRVTGELESLSVEGDARISLDGERIDPDAVGDGTRSLAIVGNGSSATFELTVGGDLERVPVDGDPTETGAIVSGTTAEGAVDSGIRYFRFTGPLLDLRVTDGSATVYLDGERVDPADHRRDPLPHAIVIDGSDADGPSSYAVTIDGEIADARGAAVDGSTVRGVVDDWRDVYWFDGDVTDFRLAGDADVDVQYDVRN